MLDVRDYADGWERKRRWYADKGYVEGHGLLWTSEVDGLDAGNVDQGDHKDQGAFWVSPKPPVPRCFKRVLAWHPYRPANACVDTDERPTTSTSSPCRCTARRG